jgi:lysophospholipid hydrolase
MIYNLLYTNYQISISFSSIFLIVLLIVGLGFVIARYTYLTDYSNSTKPQPEATPSSNSSILVNNKKQLEKRSTYNYLDQFLTAIRVLGYLEPPVFHELTKNMTTQKLSSDEILYLDENLGFSIVVDGILQVYSRCADQGNDFGHDELNYEKDDILMIEDQRYQLLNEVKPGSSLSALISTLDLFKLPEPGHSNGYFSDKPKHRSSLDIGQSPISSPSHLSSSETPSVQHYPNVVAKPKVNPGPSYYDSASATIAIIPHIAFQRVHAKYPKATSHIVTMVLNRLYKVTLGTIHNYLGLTKEIIDSEIMLNVDAEILPSFLHDRVMDKVDKSSSDLTNLRLHSATKFNTLHVSLHKESSNRYVMLESRLKPTFSGDLLSSVPISKRPEKFQIQRKPSVSSISSTTSTIKREGGADLSNDSALKLEDIRNTFINDLEETRDNTLGMAIVENIFKLIGIDEDEIVPLSALNSGMSSPNSSITAYGNGDPVGSIFNNTSTPIKIYSTINQGTTDTKKVLADQLDCPKTRNKVTFNINDAKKEFSNVVEIKYFGPNTTVVEQGSMRSGLFFVIDGTLDVIHEKKTGTSQTKSQSKLYTVMPGGLAGYLSSIIGFRSLVKVKTSESSGTVVAHLPQSDYNRLMDKYYFLQLPVASKLKSLLSKQILTIDYALEWCHIPAGNLLCSQGEMANGFHLVLSGRFRVFRNLNEDKRESTTGEESENVNDTLVDESTSWKHPEDNENIEILGEYGHGESIGEVEVLTASRRTTSLVAVRDSETARIPRTLFELLSIRNPSIMVKVSRIVANKVLLKNNIFNLPNTHSFSTTTASVMCDYKTISILPTVSGLPVKEFADKLVNAFKIIGRKVIALDQATTLTHLGRHAFDERLGQLKLSGYFAYLEEEYDMIVYVCDSSLKSSWTATCISQGDCNLLLADAEDESVAGGFGEYERLLVELKTSARTDLILLHSEKTVAPGSTSIWLKNRHWVQGHHHIYMEVHQHPIDRPKPKRNNTVFRDLAKKINKNTPFESVSIKAISSFVKLNNSFMRRDKPFEETRPHKNDFLRLARILSNEAVGIVLGGGGSRGISHVGVVTALERHGIPIDLVGGTSIGSFVGGLYAKDYNLVSIYGRAKQFSKRISAIWRLALDLTYPVTSYITGYEFNRGIWKIFGNYEIEDFWLQYFCNSTNITNSTMDIHETGFLWRFIRASMSLAGLLPPIAYNGCMLLDGGYLDNLPVLEMKKKGAKYIIAVDVGSADDRTPQNYGDTLSGFWVLFNRWNPFSKQPNVPNMMDIQMRLAYVASVNALEQAKKTPGVIYMRPPIDDYATLDFGKFEEIYQVGLSYAENILSKWDKEGKLPKVAGMMDKSSSKNGVTQKTFARRNSI